MLNAQYDVCLAPRLPRWQGAELLGTFTRSPSCWCSLIDVLAAIFILPEVYGFEQDSEPARPGAPFDLTRLGIATSICGNSISVYFASCLSRACGPETI